MPALQPPTFEELSARAAEWLHPIPGPSPGGQPLNHDPAYEAIRAEIEKLESPSGGAVDWKALVLSAGELLRTKGKDLLLAAVLGRALQATSGPQGLSAGAALLAETLDRFWDVMYPEPRRVNARASALLWYLEKTCAAIETADSPWSEQEVAAVEVAARRLEDVTRARLGERTPAFGPLRELLERLRLAAVHEQAPPAPPPQESSAPETAEPAVTAPAPPENVPAGLASADDATEFLRRVGDSLIDAARTLRKASLADPAAYRVLRTGLWLHLAAPPPASGGRTAAAPPPPELGARLEALARQQQWPVLVEEVESALPRQRLALDLHRVAWQALAALGHDQARDAVALGVRALLARMPAMAELSFADGTPVANAETRAWIGEVTPGRDPGSPPPRPEPAASDHEACVQEARAALAHGSVKEGLVRVQAAIDGARSGRERYRLRLELAHACQIAGLQALAKGLFEELAQEASAHALDTWEPRLVAEALKGLILTSRALAHDPRGVVPQLGEHHRRLCGIDPAAAHEVWP